MKILHVILLLVMTLSMGVTASDKLTAMTDYERAALKSINDIRMSLNSGFHASTVTPNPAIGLLQWDRQMASKMQAYVDQCIWGHSEMHRDERWGENLAYSAKPDSDIDAMQQANNSWMQEMLNYDIATNTCTGVCGHWTQQAWGNTKYIGCATTYCETIEGLSFSGYYSGCVYNPPGNYYGRPPYSIDSGKQPDYYDFTIASMVIDNVLYMNSNLNIELKLLGVGLDSMLSMVINATDLSHHQKELRYIGEDLTLYVPHLLIGETDFSLYILFNPINNVWSIVNFWVNR